MITRSWHRFATLVLGGAALAFSIGGCSDSSSSGGGGASASTVAPSSSGTTGSTSSGSSTASTASITSLRAPSGLAAGQITLAFKLAHPASTPTSVSVEYSTDAGQSWQGTASVASGSGSTGLFTAPAPGLEHTYVWDSAQDIPGFAPDVRVRVAPIGQPGAGLESASFAVDNQPLSTHVAFNRRPFLQSTTQTETYLLWRTQISTDTVVQYGPTPALGLSASAPGSNVDHQVRLSGLQAGATYYYRVVAGGLPISARASFHTAPAASQGDMRFVVVGDSGMNNPEQYAIANLMAREPADFMLHTGDIVYPIGGLGAAIPEYNTRFFKPYETLLQKIPSFPVVGNHDLYGLFGQPYKQTFVMPPNGGGLFEELYFSFEWGDAKFVAIESNTLHQRLGFGPHISWFRNQLQQNTKKWLIVYMHTPLYSAGSHGDNARLQGRIGALMENSKVDLVLTGHDHNYERTKPLKEFNQDPAYPGLVHIVTGGGGAGLRSVTPNQRTEVAVEAHHYMRFHIQGDWINGEAVDIQGRVIDSFRIQDK